MSTPIWRCDVCRTTFDADEARAAACESAGHPVTLEDGTLFLDVRGAREFSLAALHPTGRIETALKYDRKAQPAHYREYEFHNPHRVTISDKTLVPSRSGYVQISRDSASGAPTHPVNYIAPWAAAAAGLTQETTLAADTHITYSSSAAWVRPLTEPITAVLQALGASLRSHTLQHRHWADRDAVKYELGMAGGRAHRAGLTTLLRPVAVRDAHIADLQAAWFAGEQVSAPLPTLTATSKRTASTLTKDLRALVDATGVPWQPRTTATDYVNHLIWSSLMTSTRADLTLFPGPKTIAVGSVKGGVGKSTVAAALAAAIAATGKRVALVDLDLPGPSQHLLWNLGPVPTDVANMRLLPAPTTVPGLSVFSHGQLADGMPRRWSEQASNEWVTFLSGALDLSDVDILVLDTPPGLGALHSLIAGGSNKMDLDTFVHVTTAEATSVSDVRRGLRRDMHATHRSVLVENMSWVAGTTADGTPVEVRLPGRDQDITALAEEFRHHHVTYGGSLPWQPDPTALATSAQMVALATQVLGPDAQ